MRGKELAGPHCHGFQFNMAWPDPNLIEHLAIKTPRILIVLQIGKHCFEDAHYSSYELASRIVSMYGHLCDCVLFDRSEGHGELLNPLLVRKYLAAMRRLIPEMGLGVAGNLGPENLEERLSPLIPEFQNLSHDSFTQIHNADGSFCPKRAVEQILRDAKLFEGYGYD
ncbi:MAG: hypothetical protein ACREGC_01235, partial [Minisyncoccia bacterium]